MDLCAEHHATPTDADRLVRRVLAQPARRHRGRGGASTRGRRPRAWNPEPRSRPRLQGQRSWSRDRSLRRAEDVELVEIRREWIADDRDPQRRVRRRGPDRRTLFVREPCSSIGITPRQARPVRSVTAWGRGPAVTHRPGTVQHERTQARRVASGTSVQVPTRCAKTPP